MSIVWEDAPHDDADDPIASILVMDGEDAFSWVRGDDLAAFLQEGADLMRSPRRVRCSAETAAVETPAEAG